MRRAWPLLLVGLLAACRPDGTRRGDGGFDARGTFNATCARCHGETGRADTEAGRQVGAKDLTRDEARRMVDGEIAHQIVAGKGRMPAFGSAFTDEEVRELVGQVRRIQAAAPR